MDEIYIVIEGRDGEILDVFEEYYASPEDALKKCRDVAQKMFDEDVEFCARNSVRRERREIIDDGNGWSFFIVTHGMGLSCNFWFTKLRRPKKQSRVLFWKPALWEKEQPVTTEDYKIVTVTNEETMEQAIAEFMEAYSPNYQLEWHRSVTKGALTASCQIPSQISVVWFMAYPLSKE